MAISTRTPLSAGLKTVSLGVLYFVQGIPYGFQDKLVPLVLIMRGHSASSVALTRLLLLPWLAKPLLAPLIETTLTKAKWVIFSLSALAIISLCASLEHDNGITPRLTSTLFFLNLGSAIQDVAVDAIAIAVLSSGGEVTSGNAAQIVGFKMGALGNGFLFWIYTSFGWNGLFMALFGVYTTVLALFLLTLGPCLVETNIDQWSSLKQAWDEQRQTIFSVRQISRLIGGISPSTRNLLCYLVLYKLGESAATTTFPFFLAHQGVTNSQIAFWNGTVAMLCSIAGSTLASRLSLSRLTWTIMLRLLPLFLQLLLIGLAGSHFDVGHHPLLYYCSMLSLITLHFIGGAVTTLTFSLMMSSCQSMPESFRATRYTLMSSVEVFGKLMFASLSGFCVDLAGFAGAHLLYLVLSASPLLLLLRLDYSKQS